MKTLLFIPFLFVCSMVIGQTYNSDSIIGKPYKLTKFEVAQNDFPKTMFWNDAVKACTDLGNGWRLPTKDELHLLYKVKIGGFTKNFYWSSTEVGSTNEMTWYFSFWIGGVSYTTFKDNGTNNPTTYVRAVRSF